MRCPTTHGVLMVGIKRQMQATSEVARREHACIEMNPRTALCTKHTLGTRVATSEPDLTHFRAYGRGVDLHCALTGRSSDAMRKMAQTGGSYSGGYVRSGRRDMPWLSRRRKSHEGEASPALDRPY